MLSATLELPHGEPEAYAIFAHCFGCSKDMLASARISRELTKSGIAVLRFDFTGLGQSCGNFADTNFTSNVDDIVYAAKYLKENLKSPQLLIGHSLGGAAVIAAASLLPDVAAVASIAAPSNPSHVSHLFNSQMDKINNEGFSTINIAGNELVISKQYVDDLEKHSLEAVLENWRKAFLIFHSPTDDVVGIEHARILFKAAKHPKSFISLDRSDHLLSKREDAEFVAKVIGAWAKRYINYSKL